MGRPGARHGPRGEDIRIAIEDGCAAFDLLKGDYAYKYRFGAVPRAVKRFVASRG